VEASQHQGLYLSSRVSQQYNNPLSFRAIKDEVYINNNMDQSFDSAHFPRGSFQGQVEEPTIGQILNNSNVRLRNHLDGTYQLDYLSADRHKTSMVPQNPMHKIRVVHKKQENKKLEVIREYLEPAKADKELTKRERLALR